LDRLEAARHDPPPQRPSPADGDSGSSQHVTIWRVRALFAANPLERFWPAWLALFLLGAAYTAYSAWLFNPLGFMLGAHFIVAFGLLSWGDGSKRALARLLRRPLRE